MSVSHGNVIWSTFSEGFLDIILNTSLRDYKSPNKVPEIKNYLFFSKSISTAQYFVIEINVVHRY